MKRRKQRRSGNFGKMEIVNCLSSQYGFRNFLEISSQTTGAKFGDVNPTLFDRVERLCYNVPSDFEDGSPITFRTSSLEIDAALSEIKRGGKRYDVILVDPYHDYRCSIRDIEAAYELLPEGGAIVVHDCFPPHGGELISPHFVSGSWCGVTFIAYVDFLMRHDVSFQTVDCDYGCAVIFKKTGGANSFFDEDRRGAWSRVSQNPEFALEFLKKNENTFLKLISVSDFMRTFSMRIRMQYAFKLFKRRVSGHR